MPENPNRRRQLHDYRIRSGAGMPPELYRALRLYPSWPQCTAGCGWPVDPVAGTVHPGCEGVR